MQANEDEKSNFLDNIRKRIIFFADNAGGGRSVFMESTGIKKGMFDPKDIDRAVGSDKISNILDFYKNLSAEWLLSGNGKMLKESNDTVEEPMSTYYEAKKLENGVPLIEGVPWIEKLASAGFGNGEFSIAKQDVKDYYVIPKFKNRKVDFMIEVCGSSMYPKYNSGDVVACRIIRESNFIQWNKVHVIATREQGILIKRLKKSEMKDCLLAVSDNQDYEPFDIPEKEITGVAIVVGVIRLE
ncbi:S24 family peptidase [Carboxylicivirga linearis]|uniref:S24 family peptidase n=1 Tax=Carboxylicivirga linearis TaxID=1628157 RepID=A0ABS5JZU3_9BACT|nr:S24 family peptidase [Carboxylicivirga linearis]MBS2100424.1 S24 family peptidase [Carboxylicivirga linearis]